MGELIEDEKKGAELSCTTPGFMGFKDFLRRSKKKRLTCVLDPRLFDPPHPHDDPIPPPPPDFDPSEGDGGSPEPVL